ncbi:hypothetical protein ES705_46241 [subsurface metagenome]
MTNQLVLNVVIKGENVMRNPLLAAHGIAIVGGKKQEIGIETPITSIPDFIKAFKALFKE